MEASTTAPLIARRASVIPPVGPDIPRGWSVPAITVPHRSGSRDVTRSLQPRIPIPHPESRFSNLEKSFILERQTFATYANDDEYTTLYALAFPNLDRVVQPLSDDDFRKVPGCVRVTVSGRREDLSVFLLRGTPIQIRCEVTEYSTLAKNFSVRGVA